MWKVQSKTCMLLCRISLCRNLIKHWMAALEPTVYEKTSETTSSKTFQIQPISQDDIVDNPRTGDPCFIPNSPRKGLWNVYRMIAMQPVVFFEKKLIITENKKKWISNRGEAALRSNGPKKYLWTNRTSLTDLWRTTVLRKLLVQMKNMQSATSINGPSKQIALYLYAGHAGKNATWTKFCNAARGHEQLSAKKLERKHNILNIRI